VEAAQLMFKLGRTRVLAGDEDPALLASAFDALLARGDRQTAAEAAVSLAEACWLRGDNAGSATHLDRARELAGELEFSPAKAYVVSSVSRFQMLSGRDEEAIRYGTEALAMADQLGLRELRAHALNNIGVSRVHRGDRDGVHDLERSVTAATEANAPGELCRSMFNLAAVLWERGELERAVAIVEEQIALAARIGHVWRWRFSRGAVPEYYYQLGRWEEALKGA